MNVFDKEPENAIFHLGIDETAKAHLLETGRWGKFLAILSFVGLGLLIVMGIFMGMFMSRMGQNEQLAGMGMAGPSFTILYLILAALYFYPVWSLYKFSKLIKASLNTSNQFQFNEALRHQKNIYKFLGVLSIICLALYGVAIVFMIIGAAMAM